MENEKPKEETKEEKSIDKIAEENAILEKNLALKKEMQAFEALGGKSDGAELVKPKVETAKDYADKVMRGEIQ